MKTFLIIITLTNPNAMNFPPNWWCPGHFLAESIEMCERNVKTILTLDGMNADDFKVTCTPAVDA